MNPDELRKRHAAALPEWIALYYERPMELVRGEGFRVWDSEGNEYLDFFGGIVTTISGHAVPEIVEAVQEQATKIFHSSTLYLIENQVKLAEKLIELAPISGDKKVFFTVSGTEANEAALLFATTYRGSSEVIALRSSYHGRSFATMGITGQSSWRPTARSPLDVQYVANPYQYRCSFCRNEGRCNLLCADDLRAVIETQTTGTWRRSSRSRYRAWVALSRRRRGTSSGSKRSWTRPASCLSPTRCRRRSVGRGATSGGSKPRRRARPGHDGEGPRNGLSIGAVMGRAEIIDSISPNLHVSTFGGNHLSSAGALANLNYILENDLQRNADEVGGYLKDRS
jgi:4-aminobutyrate aminotransferase